MGVIGVVGKSVRTVETLGFRASLATAAQYLDLIEDGITRGKHRIVFYQNLHGLYLYFRDGGLREAHRNAVVMVDGMPVVWLLRLAGCPARRCHRVTWVDFVWPLLERARSRGWRVFYLGSSAPIAVAGVAAAKERVPGLMIEGHHGFFDVSPGSADSREMVERINAFAPDLCLVGMGTPRQEHWVMAHREALTAPVVMTCGACMEYVAGAVRTPPRWMGRLGLEWSYRLLNRPRRFAGRYLVEPWLLLGLMLWYNLRPRGARSRDGAAGQPVGGGGVGRPVGRASPLGQRR